MHYSVLIFIKYIIYTFHVVQNICVTSEIVIKIIYWEMISHNGSHMLFRAGKNS